MSVAVTAAWTAVGATLHGAYESSSQQRDAANASRRISSENAADLLDTAIRNNVIQGDVANYNAAVSQEVGYANAAAVERNAQRVAGLMVFEYQEELRRHIRGEKQLAGSIRSQFSSSGFQTNQGTPLLYLHNELDEAERERDFVEQRGTLTVFNYLTQEQERADLMRFSADVNAEAILFNAAAESEIYLNEQVGLAAATERSGQNTADQLNAGATATAIAGLASAASAASNIGSG